MVGADGPPRAGPRTGRLSLLALYSDPDLDKLHQRLEEENITWRSFWNGPEGTGGPISSQWYVRGWPTIYVLDHEGVIRFKNVRGEAMDEAVDQLLAEMKHEAKPVEAGGGGDGGR